MMVTPLTRTTDGSELQFGTNHLGHFALANLLLEHVTGRVVTVSSTGHRFGSIDFEDLNWERRPYKAWRAYGRLKLANLLFTAELQRRLTTAGSGVLATAAHPGYAATSLQFHSRRRSQDLISGIGNRLFGQDEDGGALPTLYAAGDLPGNGFAGPGGFLEQRDAPRLVGRSRPPRTWTSPPPVEVSEQLTARARAFRSRPSPSSAARSARRPSDEGRRLARAPRPALRDDVAERALRDDELLVPVRASSVNVVDHAIAVGALKDIIHSGGKS